MNEEVFAVDPREHAVIGPAPVAVGDRVAEKPSEHAIAAPEVVAERLPEHAEPGSLQTSRGGIETLRHSLEGQLTHALG